jgi:hypothetical protein
MNTDNLTSENLGGFFGSEGLFYNRLFPSLKYTDGVKFVSDNGAAWLIVDIITHLLMTRKVAQEEFVAITLTVDLKEKKAKLVFTDGNENVLARQNYDYTNFPLPSITFFATDRVLMLASEY